MSENNGFKVPNWLFRPLVLAGVVAISGGAVTMAIDVRDMKNTLTEMQGSLTNHLKNEYPPAISAILAHHKDIERLQRDLDRAEAEIKQLAERVRENHPR